MSGRLNPPIAATFFIACLTVFLVFLRVIRAIEWSWAWVLAPVWITFLIGLAGLLIWLGPKERKEGSL